MCVRGGDGEQTKDRECCAVQDVLACWNICVWFAAPCTHVSAYTLCLPLPVSPSSSLPPSVSLPLFPCVQVEAHAGLVARAEQEAARLAEERQALSAQAARLTAQVGGRGEACCLVCGCMYNALSSWPQPLQRFAPVAAAAAHAAAFIVIVITAAAPVSTTG